MPTAYTPHPSPSTTDPRLVASGFLFGCGIAASIIDLFIFHLLLQWHHFYDLSTTEVALLADGVFHAVGWFITVWGLFLLADERRRTISRTPVSWGRWVGGVLAGLGAFQLLDGVLNHKILGIHQIRYGVDLLLYDTVWIGSAALVLAAGLLVLRRIRPAAPGPAAASGSSAPAP